jgi:hypothetical protein
MDYRWVEGSYFVDLDLFRRKRMKIEITFREGSPLQYNTDDDLLMVAALIYARFRDKLGRNIVIKDIDTITFGLD